ncbi:hypothetical protein SAMN05216466_10686 [Paraburkholderia phenazinium]|uniref:Uncharacterized protein n=1 Tax=Paraburkholderia phenazinium TaxID=60549 RepID=A0A1G7Y8U5_9BURK|nr:hypothetical protein [Paraburkholderia phenazinium]SDG92871.1 hypothetical protein SAMN05216466_10686 [Paraburkholderia phenazinium]
MIATTTPLKNVETFISMFVVAVDYRKSRSDTMNMAFDATAIVSVTVENVEHMVKVNRVAGTVGGAVEEDEKSGFATLNAALDKALGTDTKRHNIEREIFRVAERAFEDGNKEQAAKVARLIKAVHTAEASGHADLIGMTTELLVRTLLERHDHVLATQGTLGVVAGMVAHANASGKAGRGDHGLSFLLEEWATAYKRIKAKTGVGLEALRKVSEVPVYKIDDTIAGLFSDVVLPETV